MSSGDETLIPLNFDPKAQFNGKKRPDLPDQTFYIHASWLAVLALSFFIFSTYYVYCYAPIYQGKYLVLYVKNKPDSDSAEVHNFFFW